MKTFANTLVVLSLILSASCSLRDSYRIPIHQGNILSQYQVSQLKVGMTKAQVEALIGLPVINNIFHQNIWEYINQSSDSQYRLQLVFKEDILKKINPINLNNLIPLNEQQIAKQVQQAAQNSKKDSLLKLKALEAIQEQQLQEKFLKKQIDLL